MDIDVIFKTRKSPIWSQVLLSDTGVIIYHW